MPWKGDRFEHNRQEAYAAITVGRYGEAYDDAVAELVDVENGVRKHWADKLREMHAASGYHMGMPCKAEWDCAVRKAIDLLDPYSGKDGKNGEFARTEFVQDSGDLKP